MTDWDRRFLELAEHVATWSKDRSTQVGAVIVGSRKRVLSMGYNGFPRGVDDSVEARHERPEKYDWTCHGEENAILNAACDLDGATIYVHAPNLPVCVRCARNIVQSGITDVYTWSFDGQVPERWIADVVKTAQMFREAGVRHYMLERRRVIETVLTTTRQPLDCGDWLK